MVNIRLEPMGHSIKAATHYRLRNQGIIGSRFEASAKIFDRDIKNILSDKELALDPTEIERLVKIAVRGFSDRMQAATFDGYLAALEDGIASAGVDMVTQKLSLDSAHALYVSSPVWMSYSGMDAKLVEATNHIIKRRLLLTTTINKYGNVEGYNRYLLEKDLQTISGIGRNRAKTIARTENRVVRNKGKEIGYKIRDPAGEWKYKWGGPMPHEDRDPDRMSDGCKWIFTQIPKAGLPLEELKELVHEATRRFHPKLSVRDWSVHPNERHFPQKVISRYRGPAR